MSPAYECPPMSLEEFVCGRRFDFRIPFTNRRVFVRYWKGFTINVVSYNK